MRVFFKTDMGVLYQGDALEVLKTLPDNSVDTVVTSPPYWGKRMYPNTNRIWGGDPKCNHEWVEPEFTGTKLFLTGNTEYRYTKTNATPVKPGMICKKCGAWYGQLGLEPNPEMYVEHLVEFFREIKRVLKPTGNLFVNIDDTWVGKNSKDGKLRRKSLALVPELFAIKMVYEEGWILREKVIWSKKVWLYKNRTTVGNGMPDGVRDRLSHVWEYIFHFTKSQRYYFDLDAIRVPPKTKQRGIVKGGRNVNTKYLLEEAVGSRSMGGRMLRLIARGEHERTTTIRKPLKDVNAYLKQRLRESGLTIRELSELTGIKQTQLEHYFRTDLGGSAIPTREVWEKMRPHLNLGEYDEYIKEVKKPVIPTPNPKGVNPGDVVQINVKPFKGAHFAVFPPEIPEFLIKASTPVGGVVLDPFAGAGTTLVVAEKLGRRWMGIEMNPGYCELIRERFEKEV